MKKRLLFYVALLVPALLLSGCSSAFDDSDRVLASDKSVSQEALARVTSHLLEAVPNIRAEQAKLAQGGKKIKLVLNILSAPEREYTRNDPAYMNHEKNYYEVYVSYSDKDTPGPLKYDTYRVHKDLIDIYLYDSETDDFVKVA